MPPISFKSIAIAFAVEVLADTVIRALLFAVFAQGMLTTGMSTAEVEEVQKTVFDTTAYVPWAMAFGMATTVGGGYLAARLAKQIPYYHGLAMGIVGIVFILLLWPKDSGWLEFFGLIITIPLSLFGAHIAKGHMTPVE